MAFANIAFPHIFWRNQGLEYLYMPSGMPAPESKAVKTAPVSHIERISNVKTGNVFKSNPASSPETVRDRSQAAVQASPKKTFIFVPQEKWPHIWQQQFKRTKPGKIAWTYWKLADDLASGKNQASGKDAGERKLRGDFLRRFFHDLRKPAGTHTFLPACLPDDSGQLIASPDIFWSVLNELDCRGVVILGSQAARSLVIGKKINPLDEIRIAGKIVWILRDVDALATTESWYKMALAFLRNAFQQYIHKI